MNRGPVNSSSLRPSATSERDTGAHRKTSLTPSGGAAAQSSGSLNAVSAMSSKRSFNRKKSVVRMKRDADGDSPRNAADEHSEGALHLARVRQQFEQLCHRLESEGKKVSENASRIEQLERTLASIDQENTREISEHDIAVAVETERLESLQEQLSDALRLKDELTTAVSEMVDGDTLKKRSNQLRLEQLVNFVLSNASDLLISADDIDRDVTGERVRALAKYEEREHAGRELRVTFQRRRELWENYEYLWLREGDPTLKPRFSNFFTSYYDMLEPHRCRWNTCVLDRCATEYMNTKRQAWSSFVASSETSGPGVSFGVSLAVGKAARRFRGRLPPPRETTSNRDEGTDDTPTADAGPQRRAVDAEERFFPHVNRR